MNDGDGDGPAADVSADWPAAADLVAAEPMPGFDRVDSATIGVTFHAAADRPLAPGERVPVGWLRFATDTEVRCHVSPPSPSP